MTPLSAQQTLDRAKDVLKSGRGAGLPELLKLIETLSTDIYKVNLDELSELIEKDTTILAKVITVANTVAHNPGIAPVATISQAIHQIGFHRIRSLALSLMLIENTGGTGNPPEQREAAALALCSGLFAQSCAEQLGNLDPELAFASATLRHFGNIVMPAISLEHARAAVERLKTKPEDIAYRGVFGLTPIELTRRLLAASRLPEEVNRSLRDCQPESMGGMATTFEARLLGVADLAGRLARHALEDAADSETFLSRSRLTARKFERFLPAACDLIEPAILHTNERLQSFLRCSGVSSLPTPSLARMRMHAHYLVPPEGTDAIATAPAVTPASPPDSVPVSIPSPEVSAEAAAPLATPAIPAEIPVPPESVATLAEPTEKAASPVSAHSAPVEIPGDFSLAGDAPANADDAWLGALNALVKGLGAHEAWLFLRPPGGQSFALVRGIGEQWQSVKSKAAVRTDQRSVFGVCLSRGENIFIQDSADPKLTPYLPSWFHEAAGRPGAF